ncbi:MAG TPA: hypothetical protein VJL58_12360 [Pyrinomonadaceae bacterium]|nr:hypothetical protein [Pyrinomonadaceae bacterium]
MRKTFFPLLAIMMFAAVASSQSAQEHMNRGYQFHRNKQYAEDILAKINALPK